MKFLDEISDHIPGGLAAITTTESQFPSVIPMVKEQYGERGVEILRAGIIMGFYAGAKYEESKHK